MEIYVKFCGGCNPRYDRDRLAKSIEQKFPEHEFLREYRNPDVSIIICGCSAACADKKDAAAPYGICTLWSEDAGERAQQFIRDTYDRISSLSKAQEK